MWDFNTILSSCESIINYYASVYEPDYDKAEDLKQDLRIKVWNAIENKYDSSRGSVYDFAFGVIRLESKKYVLDAHKYRQSYFENNLDRYGDIDYSTTIPFSFPVTDFDTFKSNFCVCLTPKQRYIFDIVCDECSNIEFVYQNSSKFKLNRIVEKAGFDKNDCMAVYNAIKVKLLNYAINHRMLVNFSTAEAI